MNYRYLFIGLLLLLTAFACTKRLSKSELADVLVDMYISDYLFGQANLYRQQDSTSVYRSVFQKHKCTDKQFQASIKHYGSNPKHLREVYDEVDKKIKLLKKNYGDVVDDIRMERALQIKMDSLYRYPSDTFYRYIVKRCLLLDQEFAIASLQSAIDTTTVEPIKEVTKDVIREVTKDVIREDIVPFEKKMIIKSERLKIKRPVDNQELKAIEVEREPVK